MPPAINDNEGTDLAAWLTTIPGIPANWPSADRGAGERALGSLDNLHFTADSERFELDHG